MKPATPPQRRFRYDYRRQFSSGIGRGLLPAQAHRLAGGAARRGVFLAVTLGSLLGGGMVPSKALVQISPWQLQQVGMMTLNGVPLDSLALTMIGVTIVWCVGFLVAAVLRFQ